MNSDYKTGFEWNRILEAQNGLTICDPDGWNRTNDSFYSELISEEEFQKRLCISTIVPVHGDET